MKYKADFKSVPAKLVPQIQEELAEKYDACNHKKFNEVSQRCEACGMPCEHLEFEDGQCMDCGFIQQDGPEPDYDYDQAYEEGFEDMLRRVPDTRKLHELIQLTPPTTRPPQK